MRNFAKRVIGMILTVLAGCAEYDENTADPTDGPIEGYYWVARACGPDCLELNGMYCDSEKAVLVGDCAVEGLSWANGKSVVQGDNGWFRYALTGNVQECHISLNNCGNVPTTCTGGGTWADYGCPGSPAAPGTQEGGPYLYCGNYLGGDYTCNVAFIRDAGKSPQPRGILPTGP